ncbi:MAG: FHA domain-containing protein, partial [Gaiellales bacterium]
AGEAFTPEGERTTIGRAPDSDVFLDDITVSRHHAVLLRQEDGYYVQDQGSLNGTYVNHVRVETQKVTDGDQLQIGKFKLTFIAR